MPGTNRDHLLGLIAVFVAVKAFDGRRTTVIGFEILSQVFRSFGRGTFGVVLQRRAIVAVGRELIVVQVDAMSQIVVVVAAAAAVFDGPTEVLAGRCRKLKGHRRRRVVVLFGRRAPVVAVSGRQGSGERLREIGRVRSMVLRRAFVMRGRHHR